MNFESFFRIFCFDHYEKKKKFEENKEIYKIEGVKSTTFKPIKKLG